MVPVIWMKSMIMESEAMVILIRLKALRAGSDPPITLGNLSCTAHFSLEVPHGEEIESIYVS